MKKIISWMTLIVLLVFSTGFMSCSKDDESERLNPDNLFAGTWTDGYAVNIIITETTWTAKVEGTTYNSGTYTYDGKLIVSNFSDPNMNGTYTKKN